MHRVSNTNINRDKEKDARVKTLTIREKPQPSLKLALGFETLWGEFNQNKQRLHLKKMLCILFTLSHFFCCGDN